MRPGYKHWTKEEDAVIIANYTPLKHGIKIDGRSQCAVSDRIHKLILRGLIQSANWTLEQETILKKEYPNSCASKELCRKLNKTPLALKMKAMRLGLRCRENCKRKIWGGTRPRGKDSNRFNGYEGISGSYVGALRKAAKDRDLEHPLLSGEQDDFKYLWELYLSQDKKCALGGFDIRFPDNEFVEQTASLDRIDSGGGYTKGNVQWVHKWVNQMKWDLSQEDFVDICSKIHLWNTRLNPIAPST